MTTEFNLSDFVYYAREIDNGADMDSGAVIIKSERVKEFIKRLKKSFDESANKTDIWDNERYDKFRKIYRKEIDKLAGEKLT